MNTPNFTAEASLYKTSGYYHMAGAYSQITEAYYLAREPGPPVARQPGPPKTLFHLGPLRHRRQTVGGDIGADPTAVGAVPKMIWMCAAERMTGATAPAAHWVPAVATWN